MKLVVIKKPSSQTIDKFDYIVIPMKITNDQQAALFELSGNIVIDVPELMGKKIIRQAQSRLRHEAEIAILVENKLNGIKTPESSNESNA